MSIYSMAGEAVIKSREFSEEVKRNVTDKKDESVVRAEKANHINQKRPIIFKYIPTESVTLYIAASSITTALITLVPWLSPERIYWFFAALTPLLVLLIYLGKHRDVSGKSISFLSVSKWPLWRMFAATVAFLAWALAVPNNPYIGDNITLGSVAGFIALFTSTILGVLEPMFERRPAQ